MGDKGFTICLLAFLLFTYYTSYRIGRTIEYKQNIALYNKLVDGLQNDSNMLCQDCFDKGYKTCLDEDFKLRDRY